MTIPSAFKNEYALFLRDNGFEYREPQTLLLELASLSMDVYLKEIAWLSEFIGRVEQSRKEVA
ncbi:hypothetical protein E1297_07615 [Roseibium sp. RKSG952]|nr:hypothetical protein [Roseibium sp. RKSG952]MTH95847.1 hypothetical protein [Roseibium sp. RKSG952]